MKTYINYFAILAFVAPALASESTSQTPVSSTQISSEVNKEESNFKEFLQTKLLGLINGAKYNEAINETNKYMSSHNLTNGAKQNIMSQIIAPIYLQTGDVDKALSTMEEAYSLDKTSQLATQLAPAIQNLKTNKDQIKAAMQQMAKAEQPAQVQSIADTAKAEAKKAAETAKDKASDKSAKVKEIAEKAVELKKSIPAITK